VKDASRFDVQHVNRSEFLDLFYRVDVNEQRIIGLTELHSDAVKNVKQLQRNFESKTEENDKKMKAIWDDNEGMKQDIALLKSMMLKGAFIEGRHS
jgi:hypothetical protein